MLWCYDYCSLIPTTKISFKHSSSGAHWHKERERERGDEKKITKKQYSLESDHIKMRIKWKKQKIFNSLSWHTRTQTRTYVRNYHIDSGAFSQILDSDKKSTANNKIN